MGTLQKTKKYFIAGLVVLVEVAILLFFLSLIWNFFTLLGMKLVGKIIRVEMPLFSNVFSFLIMMGVTFLLGIFISSKVGKRVTLLEEKLLAKIPFIGGAIFTFKIITDKNSPVVLVENFRVGSFQVGFITKSWLTSLRKKLVAVYIPTTPVVTTGFTFIFLKNETERLNISGQEAMEFNATAGSNSPLKVIEEISRAREQIIFGRERRKEKEKFKRGENFLRERESIMLHG